MTTFKRKQTEDEKRTQDALINEARNFAQQVSSAISQIPECYPLDGSPRSFATCHGLLIASADQSPGYRVQLLGAMAVYLGDILRSIDESLEYQMTFAPNGSIDELSLIGNSTETSGEWAVHLLSIVQKAIDPANDFTEAATNSMTTVAKLKRQGNL